VPVEPGQELPEGATLVILEAMKMENEMRAPRAGTVHEIRIAPGDQVALGQVLMSLR
jgi:biotin carboxyl carrier protein